MKILPQWKTKYRTSRITLTATKIETVDMWWAVNIDIKSPCWNLQNWNLCILTDLRDAENDHCTSGPCNGQSWHRCSKSLIIHPNLRHARNDWGRTCQRTWSPLLCRLVTFHQGSWIVMISFWFHHVQWELVECFWSHFWPHLPPTWFDDSGHRHGANFPVTKKINSPTTSRHPRHHQAMSTNFYEYW